MSKDQIDKVVELLKTEWKVIPPPDTSVHDWHTTWVGTPVKMVSPDGKYYMVDAKGVLIPIAT